MNKIFIAIIFVGLLIVGASYIDKQNNQSAYFMPTGRQAHEYAQLQPEISTKKIVLENKPDALKCNFAGEVLVTKVIDGDTIVVQGGEHIRLIGIDADEKNYPCFDAAKKELENLILNKKVVLHKDVSDVDKYDRCLNYVFSSNQNINIEMVKRGLAVARIYVPDIKYKSEIQLAETQAIASKTGCKWRTP